MAEELAVYAVRNREGKWFRRKGYGGYGETWVDEFVRARIFTKPGGARAVVSFFANKWPQHGTPSLVKLIVGQTVEMDEAQRVADVKARRERAEAKWEKEDREREFEAAKRGLEEATARLAKAQAAGK